MEKKPDENVILNLSFDFALHIVRFCDQLQDQKKYVLSNQLLKSGTSIGANIREAQGAESKNDFIHKLRIAYKEAEETEYWLLILKHSYDLPNINETILKLIPIKKLLNKIIKTSRNNKEN